MPIIEIQNRYPLASLVLTATTAEHHQATCAACAADPAATARQREVAAAALGGWADLARQAWAAVEDLSGLRGVS